MNASHTHEEPISTAPNQRIPLDVNLPVVSVTGERARILATDRNHPLYPIVVSIFRHDGVESELRAVTTKGCYIDGFNSPLDIVNK